MKWSEWRQATRYLPERLAMMLIRVEAGHTLLPKRLAMMLVAVEVGHVVGHVLSIFSGSIELPTEWDH